MNDSTSNSQKSPCKSHQITTEQPTAFSVASRWLDSMDSGNHKAAWSNLAQLARLTLVADKRVQH